MDIVPSGTRRRTAWRALVYGAPGIGKTTLAGSAPTPLLLDLEDGGENVAIDRTPVLKTYDEVMDALRWFFKSKYETAVIDTLDLLEVLIYNEVCRQQKWKSIEEGNYGKGYAYAQSEWLKLLDIFEMCSDKGKNILGLAHEQIKRYDAPDSEGYERYNIKLHHKSSNIIVARFDAVLFAQIETIIKKDKSKDRVYAAGTGERVLRCEESPAWIAKNRFSLCETEPMNGEIFAKFRKDSAI